MAGSDHHPGGRQGAPLVFDELRWVIQIRHSLQEDGGEDDDDNGIPVSVFNVPKQLQVHKPEAYVPQFIALGPYHHWRPELYEMERYKLAAARRAQRHLRAGVKLEQLVEQFARLERKVRAYYHRYLDFSGETLAWMMVVDGAFLLEFLQIFAAAEASEDGGGGKPALRRVSSRMAHLVDFAGRKSAHNLILRDMLMLENQLPLLVLERLLFIETERSPVHQRASNADQINRMVLRFLSPTSRTPAAGSALGLHPLDVLRRSMLHGSYQAPRGPVDAPDADIIRSAVELYEAGIRFRRSRTDSLHDIRFRHGVLAMPAVAVDDSTEYMLLNMMAFERLHPGAGNDVTAYVFFMDNIIDSAKDVALLSSRGIIQNAVGSDKAVAKLFNSISRDVVLEPESALDDVHRQVNAYCRQPWNMWRANLVHTYFRSPWAFLSLAAAVFLLVMTVMQTVYTVLSFYQSADSGVGGSGGSGSTAPSPT